MTTDMTMRLIYLLLLLFAVGGWVLVEYRGRMGQGLRTMLAWLMIFVAAVIGVGLWQDLASIVMPVQTTGTGNVSTNRAGDGHFYLTLKIDGVPIEFLVDTGATSMVLAAADAEDLGIDLAGLSFTGRASTANGLVRTARVNLQNVELGPFYDANVTARVNDSEMDGSLLGMEYLNRYRMEIDGNRLILSR